MTDLLQTAITSSLSAGRAILNVYGTEDFGVELKADNSPLTIADKRSHQIIADDLETTGIPILSEEGRDIPFTERKHWKRFWLVDPLDGTKEFVKRNGEFTVNIALIKNGKPVMGVIYVPVTDVLYFGSSEVGAYRLENAEKEITDKDWNEKAIKLPVSQNREDYRVVASRSHMNADTESFVDKLRQRHSQIEIVSKGSSIKLCLVAEGEADIYPRFGPTSEWDTAAGHAIILASGGKVVLAEDESKALTYNKENILNPYFIAQKR